MKRKLVEEGMHNSGSRNARNSSVELLKIFAILLIVTSHVNQTLTSTNEFISYNDYIYDLSGRFSVCNVILTICSHFGSWGNYLFFICSAWFLLQSTSYDKRKWFRMLFEIWFVSIAILLAMYIGMNGDLSLKLMVKCLFPTTFANNWYMTCYLMFYPIHPWLNVIIDKMSKVQLCRSVVVLSVLYIFMNSVQDTWFCGTNFTLWIAIYFVMAYMKKYMTVFTENVSINVRLLIATIVLWLILVVSTCYIKIYIDNGVIGEIAERLVGCRAFLLIISITLFNIVHTIEFNNAIINGIASMSMLVYIIHENLLIRTYVRPAMWEWVYKNYGYSHLLVYFVLMVVTVAFCAIIISILYDATIRKVVYVTSNRVYEVIKSRYLKIETPR